LKEFKLSSQHSRSLDVSVDEVIDALIGQHTGLRKLTIDCFYIGRGGCAALATSPLTELYLMRCMSIDDEGARAFATGLASNTTLKVLKIDNERCIAKNICQSFTTCKVESLILFATPLTDATMLTLSNALLHNSTLKSLSLNSNRERHRELTNSGWTALSISLRVIALEELSILGNSLDDIGITVIAESLENNSSLRELDLSDNLICEDGVSALCNVLRHPNSVLKILDIRNNSIRDIGVMALSTVLRHPNSKLERLDISDNVIGDIGINALTDALINNSMLKELTIEENPDVTPAGWMNFAAVLRNPTSALEFIEASHNSINDEVVHTFADALSENKTLEELYLGICPPGYNCKITPNGHAAMTSVLCNTSSILSTFNSNHTLVAICHEFDEPFKDFLHNDLLSLLKINRENSVRQAARLKIINTHFTGSEINMQPFVEMNLSVRPHAIAWMAKDMHLYELLRAMPSLLDQFKVDVNRSKKRTRKI
jgi:hypothetical protein